MSRRPFFVITILSLLGTGVAFADDEESAEQEPPPPPPREPGSFDAGGEVRFPSGPDPDNMGKFAQFKWVAVDLKGTFFVTEQISIGGILPLAPIKQEPGEIFGGFLVRPEIALGSMIGVGASVGFMTEGGFLLSPKDYPIYQGDLKFGASLGPWIKFKYAGVEFRTQPAFVYQATDPTLTAIQLPIAAAVGLGKAVKVALETGVYTGDDFKLGADDGGRIALGAAIDLKLTPVLVHIGAGFASLLTSDEGGFYPGITDSIYLDLNVKYSK